MLKPIICLGLFLVYLLPMVSAHATDSHAERMAMVRNCAAKKDAQACFAKAYKDIVAHEDGEALQVMVMNGFDLNQPLEGEDIPALAYYLDETGGPFAYLLGKSFSPTFFQLLIDLGADIYDFKKDSKNGSYQQSPIYVAIVMNNVEAVRILLKAGALNRNGQEEVDEAGITPLTFATMIVVIPLIYDQSKVYQVVELLILAGSDVNHKNIEQVTPLMLASLAHHDQMVQLLLENGAIESINEKDTGLIKASAIHYAVQLPEDPGLFQLPEEKYLNTIRLLVEAGADLNSLNGEGQTVLDKAYEQAKKYQFRDVSERLIQYLLAHRAKGKTGANAPPQPKKTVEKPVQDLLDQCPNLATVTSDELNWFVKGLQNNETPAGKRPDSFRELALKVHPDKGGKGCEPAFRLLFKAK